jgi:glycosyltransferase involved in cell wall biosynthesis
LRLAILGTRGVPPRYGGFETFAAELGRRLVARGHEVTVYCRPPVIPSGSEGPGRGGGTRLSAAGTPPSDEWWEGIRRIELPAIPDKYFETVSHTALSALDALRRDFDAVLVCNAANAFVLPLLRAARIPVAINVDGIERRRRKWNPLGKAVYAAGESLSVVFANRIVADAEVIAGYYRETFAADPVVIPYGSELPVEEDSDVLGRLGLQPRGYVLYVSRFEPENNPLEVAEAWVSGPGSEVPDARSHVPGSGTRNPEPGIPLVMLGEARYDRALGRRLQELASPRLILPGALYGSDYRTLQRHALVYIQATEVGGTHPAMIEAMASGGCVLAHDTPENREVGGDAVRYFEFRPVETLSGMLRECLGDPAGREAMRERARRRAAERYGWEGVTDAYEELFREMA